jgi:uncharacterized Ntn-hydrolase superfamily protein
MQTLERFSTFSIVARDAKTGRFGAAVQTHQMCVGAVVPWLDPVAGALVTQAMTNVNFGPRGLDLLRGGLSAKQVAEALLATDDRRETRQLAVVDRSGEASAWTGADCIREAGHFTGQGYSVQANMMEGSSVIESMGEAFEAADGDLADRMMAALHAAQEHGGDIRGMQSAALKVVGRDEDGTLAFHVPRYDLRVDEHEDPIKELTRLVRLRKAQLIDANAHRDLENGEIEAAMVEWARARELAPELEELPFWQAIGVLEEKGDLGAAAAIFKSELSSDPRFEHWIDLVHRLEECGILTQKGSAQALEETVRAGL